MKNVNWEIVNGASFAIKGLKENQGSIFTKKEEISYKWDLTNIHFHIPSEHTIDDQRFDMEIHFIHMKDKEYLVENSLKNMDLRGVTVIGLMIKIGDNSSGFIEKMNFEKLTPFDFEVSKYLYPNQPHYIYEGSLTTPECTEIVNWIVLKNPIIVSDKEFKVIEKWVKSIYPIGNSRPVNPLNGRIVYKRNIPQIPTPKKSMKLRR